MKKILLILAVTLVSCSNDETQKQTTVTVCGEVNRLGTYFTAGSPSTFIAVAYDIDLTVPQNIGGVDYYRARFQRNDALNNTLGTQYTIHDIVCANIPLIVRTRNGDVSEGFYN